MAKKAQATTAANKPARASHAAAKTGSVNISSYITTTVLSDLKYNGIVYKTGSRVTLDLKTYNDLLAKGVVSPASDTAVKSSGDLTQKEDDTTGDETTNTDNQEGEEANKVDGDDGEGADSEEGEDDEDEE